MMTAPSAPAEESKEQQPATVVPVANGIHGSITLSTTYAPNPFDSAKSKPGAAPATATTTTTTTATFSTKPTVVTSPAPAASSTVPAPAPIQTNNSRPAPAPAATSYQPMQIDSPHSPRGVAPSNPASPGAAAAATAGNTTKSTGTVKPGVEYMDTTTTTTTTSTGVKSPLSKPTTAPPMPISSPEAKPKVVQASAASAKPAVAADAEDDVADGAEGGTLKSRRQKRLERNRESARLSRRRRKQYLEVLEERVSQLSKEMDQGRRMHVSRAVALIANKREAALAALQQQQQAAKIPPSPSAFSLLSSARTCNELKVAATFRSQQLSSFCAPPSTKVTLWLTLQNDDYFRGGRAASERLSAARIGERMLQNGNDKVTPAQTMWPLLCNEIGLSYDQEEKVRLYQRALLQAGESWLSRHTSFAAKKSMDSIHDATQALALRIGSRERNTSNVLKGSQMARLHAYVKAKRQEIASKLPSHSSMPPTPPPAAMAGPPPPPPKQYETVKTQHVSANLYVLNHRLQTILKTIPKAAPLVVGPSLKKLSRRPSFESLGARSGGTEGNSGGKGNKNGGDEGNRSLSRDNTFPSTGSLKRTASEMSMDSGSGSGDAERHHRPSVDPMEAQSKAQETIQKYLGHVKEIMPTHNVPTMAMMLPQGDRASGILPVASSSSTPSPPPTTSGEHMSAVDPAATFEMIAGEPLPDPVPMSVLSSTPAPAFMTPPPGAPLVAAPHQPPHVAPVAQPPAPTYAPGPAPILPHPGAPGVGVQPAAGMYMAASHPASAPANLAAHGVQPAQPAAAPAPTGIVPTYDQEPKAKNLRSASSFFPPALGVVPEEMWSAEAAEDFLMNFVDEDWAIGEGVETDMP